MTMCEHQYRFIKNESYYQEASRYSNKYISIDYFYCEKCLDQKQVKKQETVGLHEIVPDWAKLINKKIAAD